MERGIHQEAKNNKQWTVNSGQWTMDNEQWTWLGVCGWGFDWDCLWFEQKLAEISALQKEQAAGKILEKNQLEKIKRLSAITKELENIELSVIVKKKWFDWLIVWFGTVSVRCGGFCLVRVVSGVVALVSFRTLSSPYLSLTWCPFSILLEIFLFSASTAFSALYFFDDRSLCRRWLSCTVKNEENHTRDVDDLESVLLL